VNYSVDGPYSTSPSGANPFNAALFDKSGLYEETSPNTWVLVTESVPAAAYASRISTGAAFIQSTIPEPGTLLIVSAAVCVLGLRRRG